MKMARKPPVRTCPSDNPSASPGPASQDVPATAVETQLTELEENFDLLKAQVRQAQQLSSLGTAAAIIGHEVNNLLTPILSYAKAALEAGDVELHKKALTVTVKHVQMLLAMSERVLEISAAKPAQRESVSVGAAAKDAAASLCRDLSKDGIRFSIKVDDSIRVWADALQLQQVLFNLFLNAREAMAPSRYGRLTVSAERQGDRVDIEVSNTGEPIPPDRLSHIFDPFHSSKSATLEGCKRCSGLGLALSRDLIEENNGTITVTSNAETGTTFTLVFPVSGPAAG